MLATDGSVKGLVGRVREVKNAGAELETRLEDRGASDRPLAARASLLT